MNGQSVSHYRLLEKLGSGGMGTVYRAHDERLDRDVALKLISAGRIADDTARSRFRREALTLSHLNHPNIAVVYDFDSESGVDFIAMEYVAGETLATKMATSPFSEGEVVRLGTQIAEALEEAHERGVIHRDLKPGNVMVTEKGRVKVLDFGLAKLVRPVDEKGETASLAETQAGTVMGTVPYMAPEQLRGEKVDARADIYALGAVLYEMATGSRPFPEKQSAHLIAAILMEAPSSPRELNPQVSPGLQTILLKALEKNPEHRYQSAKELLEDLRHFSIPGFVAGAPRQTAARRWALTAIAAALLLALATFFGLNVAGLRDRALSAVGARPRPVGMSPPKIESLAVLPLENLTGSNEQEYFVEGMHEALITDLSKIKALKVVSRTSVMRYQGTKKSLPEIGKELGVDALVEGSVQRAGDRVQVTAQLIDAASDRHLWAERYERDSKDVLSLQNEVAQAIARQIRITLSPEEQTRMSLSRPVSPEAYDLYLKGRYHFYQRNLGPQEIRTARDYFEQALQKDPTYAPAYSGLADAYQVLAFRGAIPRAEGYKRGMAAANKALELDDSLAEAHASLGGIRGDLGDSAGFEREIKRAIELNPNYGQAHSWYAMNLMGQGRLDEAVNEANRAVELDPLARPFLNTLLDALYYARRYDEVIGLCRKMIELDPKDDDAYYVLGHAYELKGEQGLATEAFKKSFAIAEPYAKKWADRKGFLLTEPQAREYLAGLKQALSQGGTGAAKLYVKAWVERKSNSFPPILKALVYTRLGEKDRAFYWLGKFVDKHDPETRIELLDPDWDPLRSDPRFQVILRRLNSPQ